MVLYSPLILTYSLIGENVDYDENIVFRKNMKLVKLMVDFSWTEDLGTSKYLCPVILPTVFDHILRQTFNRTTSLQWKLNNHLKDLDLDGDICFLIPSYRDHEKQLYDDFLITETRAHLR